MNDPTINDSDIIEEIEILDKTLYVDNNWRYLNLKYRIGMISSEELDRQMNISNHENEQP